ncbi:unnamed protein product [Cuscuta campestris]|uniref:Uncharacterized protein n=1 Tax=Cuscuta campestris TaxID=132261 RepID=A0A484MWY2_9ASTE|nr:unnamed protein product [Cuscuta campestris]
MPHRPAYPTATRADVHLVGSGPIQRFEMWGRHRSLTESVYLSSIVLTEYGYAEEMEQLLQGTRWHRLFTMRAESSLPLTIEFLCSLELEPSTGSRSMNFQSIDSRTTLTFTLLGRGFQLTVADLATHLGLYSWEETSAPEFGTAPYLLPTDIDPADFWAEHSSDPDRFEGMGRASQSMGNRMHIVCGFVVTILFRSLEGSAPIPRAQMMMRDLDAGMLRNAHIRRRLGAGSTESNAASSSAPSTSGASSQVSSRRATRRRPTPQATPATTQADPTPEWARRILEQQDTILQRMSEIGQQQASQAENFAQLRRTFTSFYSDVHIGLTPRSPEGNDPSTSVTTTVGPLMKATKLWTISAQTFTKRSDNAVPATAAPRRTATAPSPAEAQARANLASIADSLNCLHFKVDGMDGYLERLDEAVQRQGYAMNAYFQRVNYVPPPYHGTFFGQVYGDEDEDDASYAPSSSLDEDEFDDTIDGDEMDVDDDEEETEDED